MDIQTILIIIGTVLSGIAAMVGITWRFASYINNKLDHIKNDIYEIKISHLNDMAILQQDIEQCEGQINGIYGHMQQSGGSKWKV